MDRGFSTGGVEPEVKRSNNSRFDKVILVVYLPYLLTVRGLEIASLSCTGFTRQTFFIYFFLALRLGTAQPLATGRQLSTSAGWCEGWVLEFLCGDKTPKRFAGSLIWF